MQSQIIEMEIPSLSNIQRRLGNMQKKAPAVMKKAINDTLKHVSKSLVEDARKMYFVKKGEAKKTLRTQSASVGNLSGSVLSSSRERIRLHEFSAKAGKPAKAHLKRGTKIAALTGNSKRSPAFIATMPSGHTGVFQRDLTRHATQKDTPRTFLRDLSKWRYLDDNPIVELYGTSIPSMLRDRKISKEAIKDGKKTLQDVLNREIQKVMERER